MARTRRHRSVRVINMNEEYQEFLRIKHPDTVCSRERYEDIAFSKSEFWGCTFQNCEIIECEATKVEFDKTIFKNCQIKQVDFGWSWFADCEFLEAKLDDINFEAIIISDLKTKNKTDLNLHFNEKFPMNFWRFKECTKIKDSLSFTKFLRNMNSD